MTPTGETPLRGRGDAEGDLVIDLFRIARCDGDQPLRGQVATTRQRVGVPARAELLDLGERCELASGAPIELGVRAIDGRLAEERDDEDVGSDIPRLVGDDTKLHGGCGSSPGFAGR